MFEPPVKPAPVLGWTGFAIGAAALLLALVTFWGGPFAPQQATGVTLGELAADIGKSAMRSVAGIAQPDPQPVPHDTDDWLKIGVAVLGGLSVVLAVAGLIRHETRRPAIGAVALGAGAILFQLFTWAVMAVIGCLLILALLDSMSGVFEGIFGG